MLIKKLEEERKTKMAEKTELTAQQRAQLFAMQTRQNFQMLAPETANTTPATLQFTLPKARLLAGAVVRLKGKINLKHASSTSVTADIFTMVKAIRRISLDLNNGFQPFVLSGVECLPRDISIIEPLTPGITIVAAATAPIKNSVTVLPIPTVRTLSAS